MIDYIAKGFMWLMTGTGVIFCILIIWTLVDVILKNRTMSKKMLTEAYRMNSLGTSDTIQQISERAEHQIMVMRNHYWSIGDGLSARAMDGALRLVQGEPISFDHADAWEALAKAENPQPEPIDDF